MKVGVFDSGVGGLAMVRAIEKEFPDLEVISVNDREHVPYGDKTPEQLLSFVVPILEGLVSRGCAIIVIACNTVTTTIIPQLREAISVPLIGMEPMVKPAAERTKTGVIAVCATPATLKSARYDWLKQTYAADVQVLEPDCSKWALMIEHSQVNETTIEAEIKAVCDQSADVIVLGCTHYHWIERTIQRMAADRALVVQPEIAVLAELKRQLALVHDTNAA
jgi:glutamate racemase